MRQLALPIQDQAPPTLNNFVVGRNAEVLAGLRGLPLSAVQETLLYLWGPPGAGKTHLLKALAQERLALGQESQYLEAQSAQPLKAPYPAWIFIDDIEQGSAALTETVFYRWNQIREGGGALVVSGEHAPTQLPIAPELSSRLAWGQVFQLEPLNDEDKKSALRTAAESARIPLTEEALDYLLTHVPRDMPTLMHVLRTLDEWSLSAQRAITVPLIREWLKSRDKDPQ